MAWTETKRFTRPGRWHGGNELVMNEIEQLLTDLERLKQLEEALRLLKESQGEPQEDA